MRKDYEKLFSYVHSPLMPEGLSTRILARIRQEQNMRILKWRISFFALMLILSATGAVSVFQSVQMSFAETGSLRFIALLLSDFTTVMGYWQSFALVLIESLPVATMALFLLLILAFLQSFKCIARDFKIVRSSLQII